MQAAATQTGHWYIARAGQQYGPITDLELGKMVELRHLHPDDFLWREGFDDWVEARRIPGLLPAGPPPPPPPSGEQRGPVEPQLDAMASPRAAAPAAHHHQSRSGGQTETQTTTETIIEGGSFKLSTLLFIILGLLIPLWPISLPVCWFMAYRSYQRPSKQTVRVVRAVPGE